MISSNDLRRISARSRGFLPAQPGNAALAASTAALASSTVALATEAILFSVAGSMTSKRAPSEALRHWPPIQRSVGTLARRFSYMGLVLFLSAVMRGLDPRIHLLAEKMDCRVKPGNDELNCSSTAAPARRCGRPSAARYLPEYRLPGAVYAAW